MDIFDQGMACGFRDIEAGAVIEGALIKVPVVFSRTWK